MSQPQPISRLQPDVSVSNRPYANTTPLPNFLLDEVMPTLKDTELRLLLIVVRQTLGWHNKQSGGRKDRDWIARSQLIQKTGRNSAALSRALEALVSRELIEVRDGAGQMLSSPLQRRKARGRVTYALHPQITSRASDRNTESAKSEHETVNQSLKKMLARSLLAGCRSKSEHAESPKANRTKETLTKITETKENQTKRVFFQIDGCGDSSDALDSLFDTEKVWDSRNIRRLPLAMQQFIALYCQHYARHFPHSAVPVIFTSALKRLDGVLTKHPKSELAEMLGRFFTCELPNVRRQWYSLEAFVHNVDILQQTENDL